MAKLRPCPFCGSDVKIWGSKRTYNELVDEHGSACLHIECTNRNCGCSYFVHHHEDVRDYEFMVAKAVKEWNRRCTDEIEEGESV